MSRRRGVRSREVRMRDSFRSNGSVPPYRASADSITGKVAVRWAAPRAVADSSDKWGPPHIIDRGDCVRHAADAGRTRRSCPSYRPPALGHVDNYALRGYVVDGVHPPTLRCGSTKKRKTAAFRQRLFPAVRILWV